MSTIATRLGRAAALTSIAAAAALGTAGSAQAAWGDCPSSRICIWDKVNATGTWGYFKEGTSDLSSSKVLGGKMNDKTSAVRNNTGQVWCLYEHKNRGGRIATIGPGRDAVMTFYSGSFYWNDKISSLRPQQYIKPPLSSFGYWTC
jgi:hypothetical protein